MKREIEIRPFQESDQVPARRLVLEGLRDQWGWLDPEKNPDLDDIATYYHEGLFLVGFRGDDLVATGALLPEKAGIWRIVRMSVARSMRRQGIGGQMLAALEADALRLGAQELVLETTAAWSDAVSFYRAHGFQTVSRDDGDLHFSKTLRQFRAGG